jgi:excisionase family DNA binding protein
MEQTDNQTNGMFRDYPDVVSVEQLMEMLHIGKVLAYRLITSRKIKAVKIGRAYKIAKWNVAEYVLQGSGR